MITLTLEECHQIVSVSSKDSNFEVISFTAEHFGDFLGFLGEYYHLNVTVLVDGSEMHTLKLFIKSLPIKDLRSRRSMLVSSGIFKKEAKIYENLLAKFIALDVGCDTWCPRLHLVRDDLIVFNDLALEDFHVPPDNVVDFESEYVEATLKSLAAFHACSIAFEQREKVKIGEAFSDILFETSVRDIPWFHSGLRTIQKIAEMRFGVESSEELFAEMFAVRDLMEMPAEGVPRVLCHRDTWAKNLMFKKDPESGDVHCVLIDFQTARYLSLTIDVNMAIILTTRKRHHEEKRNHYLQFYYSALAEKLKKFNINLDSLMSFESFLRGCEFHKRMLVVYKAIAVMLTQPPQRLFKGFTEEDYRGFAQGDRCRLVLRFMEQDAFFRECLEEAVGEIVKEFST